MVTLLKNNFEGQTADANVTTGNSADSGNAFSHVVKGTGGNFIYSASAAVNGSLGLRQVNGSGQSYVRWTVAGTDGRRCVARRSFVWSGTQPSAKDLLIDIRTEVDATAVLGDIHIRAAGGGQLEIYTPDSGDIAASRYTLGSAGTYWIEFAVIASSYSGAGDGKAEYRLYGSDGVTLITSWSSAASLGITHSPPNIARLGGGTTATGRAYDDMDDIQALFTDGLTDWIGPYDDTKVLDTPTVTVTGMSKPTTPGGNDGSLTLVWPRINDVDVDHYEVGIAAGHGATSGFTSKGTVAQPVSGNATKTITGLSAGNYTVAVRAMPED